MLGNEYEKPLPFFSQGHTQSLKTLNVRVSVSEMVQTARWHRCYYTSAIGSDIWPIKKLSPYGTDGRLLLKCQLQSHVTQQLGQKSGPGKL